MKKRYSQLICLTIILFLCACSSNNPGADVPSAPGITSSSDITFSPSTPPPLQHSPSSLLMEEPRSSELEVYVEGYVERLDDSINNDLRIIGFEKERIHIWLGYDFVLFQGYEQYLDKGLSFQYNQVMQEHEKQTFFPGLYIGKVSNLLIDKNYTDDIIDGITMQSSVEDVIERLGPPPYWDEEINLLGYKLRDCYLFFWGDSDIEEVSVYPLRSSDGWGKEISLTSLIKNMEAELGGLRSMESVFWYLHDNLENYTYGYLDALKYSKRYGTQAIRYADLGIELLKNNSEPWSLTLYGNCGITEELLNNQNDNIKILPKIDLIFETEKDRVTKKLAFPQWVVEAGVVSPDGKRAVLSNDELEWYGPYEGIYVVGLDESIPNIELYGASSDPHWLSNRYILVHSEWGVQIYDLNRKRVIYAYDGDKYDHYVRFEDGKIMDSDYEGNVHGWILYSFDKNGEIKIVRCDAS